eukprot:scaffold247826_cov19-Tisochrysis_lutea.AAC.1
MQFMPHTHQQRPQLPRLWGQQEGHHLRHACSVIGDGIDVNEAGALLCVSHIAQASVEERTQAGRLDLPKLAPRGKSMIRPKPAMRGTTVQ